MKMISTSELRTKTRSLVHSLSSGQAVGLTYRGHPLAQIFPVRPTHGVSAHDPLYRFHRHATRQAKPLADREMDRMIYGG